VFVTRVLRDQEFSVWKSWMSIRRLSFALLLAASTGAVGVSRADACCLTDWLFGRTKTPYYAGYAPIQTLPLATPPIVTTNYSGNYNYAANYAAPYAANYATAYTAQPMIAPVASNGVFQAQRPVLLNNPSVYTGLPTAATAQAAYSIPITTAPGNTTLQSNYYRGAVPVGGSYMGASNAYPRTTIQSNMQTSYQNPSTTMLPTTNVAPLFPPAPAGGGGLGQFFGSMFGTNYTSSYYQAPVTYYRPVTSVDPMTGTTVTVQQPCTSDITQVQRSPYSSLFADPSAAPMIQGAPTYTTPIDNCNQPSAYGSPAYGSPAYGSPAYGASPYGQSGVSQAGAYGVSPDQFTVPIPSIAPSTASPLTGSPMQPRSQSGSDLAPLDQPRLETYRAPQQPPAAGFNNNDLYNNGSPFNSDRYLAPPVTEPTPSTTQPSTTQPSTMQPSTQDQPPKSYWQLQDADDSTAMIRPEPAPRPVMTPPSFTAAEPIRGLDSEPSPFELRDAAKASATSNFQAPPLPPASQYDPFGDSRAEVRRSRSIPVREAALVRQQPAPAEQPAPVAQPVAKPQRDSRWFAN
jgi:hypothetical protein